MADHVYLSRTAVACLSKNEPLVWDAYRQSTVPRHTHSAWSCLQPPFCFEFAGRFLLFLSCFSSSACSSFSPRRSLLVLSSFHDESPRPPPPFLLLCASYPHVDCLRASILCDVKAAAPAAAPGTLISLRQLQHILVTSTLEEALRFCKLLGVGEPAFNSKKSIEGRESQTEETKKNDTAAHTKHSGSSYASEPRGKDVSPGLTLHKKVSGKGGGLVSEPHVKEMASSASVIESTQSLHAVGLRLRRGENQAVSSSSYQEREEKDIRAPQGCTSTKVVRDKNLPGADSWTRLPPVFERLAPRNAEEFRNLFAWPPPL